MGRDALYSDRTEELGPRRRRLGNFDSFTAARRLEVLEEELEAGRVSSCPHQSRCQHRASHGANGAMEPDAPDAVQ